MYMANRKWINQGWEDIEESSVLFMIKNDD